MHDDARRHERKEPAMGGDEPFEPEHDEELFEVRVPGPPHFAPPLAPDRDVVYFRQRVGGEGKREGEDIMLRRVPTDVARRFRAAAGARGLTHAQYLAALVALHDALRARADGGDAGAAEELDRLGLATVSI
jgi:hypothetical protein